MIFHWRKEAAEFVRRNREVLAARPCGCSAAVRSAPNPPTPRPGPAHGDSAERDSRGHRGAVRFAVTASSFGALDPRTLTFAERSLRKLPAARAALPEGDFRDWPEIDDWAAGIARELQPRAERSTPRARPTGISQRYDLTRLHPGRPTLPKSQLGGYERPPPVPH